MHFVRGNILVVLMLFVAALVNLPATARPTDSLTVAMADSTATLSTSADSTAHAKTKKAPRTRDAQTTSPPTPKVRKGKQRPESILNIPLEYHVAAGRQNTVRRVTAATDSTTVAPPQPIEVDLSQLIDFDSTRLVDALGTCNIRLVGDRDQGYRLINLFARSIDADSVNRIELLRVLQIERNSAELEKQKAHEQLRLDSLAAIRTIDSLAGKIPADTTNMSARELRRYRRYLQDNDSTFVRQSVIFRDSIPISRMALFSAIAPGFGQLYNEQYWKIPVFYGLVGTAIGFGIHQNKQYQFYRKAYDGLVRDNFPRSEIDPVQTRMIHHNTYRQLLFGGAVATYIYFLGDAVVNYPSAVNSVKKATTLSMICPGAGQFYNRSYWKIPIVAGGFATFAYMIDFNNRGYQRFKRAYDYVSDDDPNTVDEFNGYYGADKLKNLKNSYRRNRDLCIIITCGWYLLNVVDAHVDAHLKDYDISDNLAVQITPFYDRHYTLTGGASDTLGFSLNLRF